MKTRSAWLASILILAAGVILTIIYRLDVFTGIVIALGIIFIIPGVINLVSLPGSSKPIVKKEQTDKSQQMRRRSRFDVITGLISSTGSVILGITMIGWSDLYIKFLPIIFAILLIIGGCFHFIAMAMAIRPIKLPVWLYVMPITLLVMGFSIIYVTSLQPHHIVLIMGAGLIIFAINTMLELWFTRKINAPAKASVHDPEVIEINPNE